MIEKRFCDIELYFTTMIMALIGLVFGGIFPHMLFQTFVITLGAIGFLNLGLFLDSLE